MEPSRSKDTKSDEHQEPKEETLAEVKDLILKEVSELGSLFQRVLSITKDNAYKIDGVKTSVENNAIICNSEKKERKGLQSKVDSLISTLNRYNTENTSIKSEFNNRIQKLEKSLIGLQSKFEESKSEYTKTISSFHKNFKEIDQKIQQILKDRDMSIKHSTDEQVFKSIFSEQAKVLNEVIDRKISELKIELSDKMQDILLIQDDQLRKIGDIRLIQNDQMRKIEDIQLIQNDQMRKIEDIRMVQLDHNMKIENLTIKFDRFGARIDELIHYLMPNNPS